MKPVTKKAQPIRNNANNHTISYENKFKPTSKIEKEKSKMIKYVDEFRTHVPVPSENNTKLLENNFIMKDLKNLNKQKENKGSKYVTEANATKLIDSIFQKNYY